ncbi:unnamed protein product [Coffea canephora]|uniref:Uncharacterized protein n=1 Tax=Coffea canephora TaxID=49390 RepID=A0A068U411_COFCA|nr:unnamed protein product [Coffea canephora]
MGTKHQSSSDPISDPKKKRRVGFSKIDAGVEANECIKIYLGTVLSFLIYLGRKFRALLMTFTISHYLDPFLK